MKLITINTWQGRLQRNLETFIKEEQPDILCMQEVCSIEGLVAPWIQGATLQTIQKASGLPHQYFSPTNSYDLMGQEVGFGNGILSRQPLTNPNTVFTYGGHHKITAETFVPNVRNAQIVDIAAQNGSVRVVNYHAHWEPNQKGSQDSLTRIKILAEVLRHVKGPLIIAGDFNVTADSDSLRYFKETVGVRSLTEELGVKSTMSNTITPWEVACDHILVNDQVEVINFSVDDRLVSDHKALVLEFEAKRPA